MSMNTGEWNKLKARYTSGRQYSRRKVLLTRTDFEDFENWLIDQKADILATSIQDEALRFKLHGETGIIYEKGSGNLLAHNLGIKYYKDNGIEMPQDYSAHGSLELGRRLP